MEHLFRSSNIVLREFCPALQCDVVLFRQTWEDHVLAVRPWLADKIPLIRKVIKNCRELDSIYQKNNDPKKISTQILCNDFLPLNHYLRVAMEIKNSGLVVVTSVYSVDSYPKKGVKQYEP